MAAAAAAAFSLSSIPRSSASSSTTFPPRAPLPNRILLPSVLSSEPKPSKSLIITSHSLSPSLLHRFGICRCAAEPDGLQASFEVDLAAESDQLLEQEHELEQASEKEGGDETKRVSNQDGRLYVGNLPYSITPSQLNEIFGEAGTIRSVEIVYDKVTDRSRGFAFVTMESVEDAEKAIRMFDQSQIGGRTVKVNFPEVPRGGERKVLEPKIKTSYQSFIDTPNKLYAGNLSWDLTSQALREAFSGQPGFLSAKVVFERDTGRSRGFGFVSFSSAEDARAAISAMNGVEVDGRPLRLNMASERTRASPPSNDDSPAEATNESGVLSGVSL